MDDKRAHHEEIVETSQSPKTHISKTTSKASLTGSYTSSDSYTDNSNNHSSSSDVVCAICCETMSNDFILLPCNHQFCSPCIKEFFTYEITHMKQQVFCPICRVVLFEIVVDPAISNDNTISGALQSNFDSLNLDTNVINNERPVILRANNMTTMTTSMIIGNVAFKLLVIGILVFFIYVMMSCYYVKKCAK